MILVGVTIAEVCVDDNVEDEDMHVTASCWALSLLMVTY